MPDSGNVLKTEAEPSISLEHEAEPLSSPEQANTDSLFDVSPTPPVEESGEQKAWDLEGSDSLHDTAMAASADPPSSPAPPVEESGEQKVSDLEGTDSLRDVTTTASADPPSSQARPVEETGEQKASSDLEGTDSLLDVTTTVSAYLPSSPAPPVEEESGEQKVSDLEGTDSLLDTTTNAADETPAPSQPDAFHDMLSSEPPTNGTNHASAPDAKEKPSSEGDGFDTMAPANHIMQPPEKTSAAESTKVSKEELQEDQADETGDVVSAEASTPGKEQEVAGPVRSTTPDWLREDRMEGESVQKTTVNTEAQDADDGVTEKSLDEESPAGITEPHATMVDIPLSDSTNPSILTKENAEKDELLVELQSSLQDHMTRQAEAEDRARQAEARIKQLEQELQTKEKVEKDFETLKEKMKAVILDKANLEVELAKVRNERDEHQRKETVLSNRVNDAKKKEALKANLAEQLEEEVKQLQAELKTTKEKLTHTESSEQKVEQQARETTEQLTQRVLYAERALADERRLNEDRKKKMKSFIETKQEEVREGKVLNEELNAELEQTNRLLREQNSRWKQLHAQWVQSQTRNRELQRDLNRLKSDSDNMHKIGDKMEMKLSRSAQETEEHKNKRLTAKHELMTILRTLEAEREVSSKLRDSIKFTFTPKALSQQQLLKESLQEFESELQQLSRRLGTPLQPPAESLIIFSNEDSPEANEGGVASIALQGEGDDDGERNEEGKDGKQNRSELDSQHLLSNLEQETQAVSQCIMALTSSIERMHALLEGSGSQTCMTALSNLLANSSGSASNASASQDERTSMNGASIPRLGSRRARYGQVPTS